jgi:hypothetical protein
MTVLEADGPADAASSASTKPTLISSLRIDIRLFTSLMPIKKKAIKKRGI